MKLSQIPRLRLALLCLALCGLSRTAAAEVLQWYVVPPGADGPSAMAPPPASSKAMPAPAPSTGAEGKSLRYGELIDDVAQRHALDPLLVHAVVETESAYRPQAVSDKGAIGLMQVMPATGMRFGQRALTEPRANLEAGAAYLSWLLRRFDGRLELALAGYNAGEGAVARYGNAVPPYEETQEYVRKVMARYARLRGGASRGIPASAMPDAAVAAARRVGKPKGTMGGVGDMGQLWRIFTGGSNAGGANGT